METLAKKYGTIIFLIITTPLYYFIGYQLVRHQFLPLIISISILFYLYILALKHLNFSWWLVVLPRLIFLISTPSLSDDYYRFVWDGNLMAQGLNPFQYLPAEFPKTKIFTGLNSKHYYSIYPPVLQLVFAASAYLAKGNLLLNIIWLRLVIILAEIGSIYLIIKLLKYFKLSKNKALIYSFNPLVIIELTGNLHFEALSIFFLLLAFYWLFVKNKSENSWRFSAIALAISVLIKMLPLIFIPIIIKYLGYKKGLFYSIIVVLIISLAFLPFVNFQIINNISQSLDLYFQKFEFNGSIYNLVKWLGIYLNNNNPIQVAGPLLATLSFLIILWLSFGKFQKNRLNYLTENTDIELIKYCLAIIAVYFIFATTIHPWYLTTLVALTCFTQFKSPIVWSFLAVLSYSAYKIEGFSENYYLLVAQYLVVFIFMASDFRKEIL